MEDPQNSENIRNEGLFVSTRLARVVIAGLVGAFGTTILTLAALIVSIVEMRNNGNYIQASLTPKVHFDTGHNQDGWHLGLYNSGLGPAEVKWFRVFVDGKEVHDWRTVLTTMGVNTSTGYSFTMVYPGSIIQVSQDSSQLVHIADQAESKVAKLNDHRIEPIICVCSFSDECVVVVHEFKKKALLDRLEQYLPNCSSEYEEEIPSFLVPENY